MYMTEPKYIIYLVKYDDNEFSFNIIDWPTKDIFEIAYSTTIVRKKLSRNFIDNINRGIFIECHDIDWRCGSNNLWVNSTIKNIKKTIQQLEGGELVYFYYV